MTMTNMLRFGALAAVLLAGSCAAPINDATIYADPEANHTISVNPTYKTLDLSFAGSAAGLMPDDAQRLDAFVDGFRTRGNGAFSISAPRGPLANEAIRFFAERVAALGVDRTRIIVGTRDVSGGDTRVELGYVTYVAHTDECGDWHQNVANDSNNLPMPNFGCATQHNLAAMVADPRDILGPRPMDAGDQMRRTTVMGKYENGDVTTATKTNDQRATVSDVGN